MLNQADLIDLLDRYGAAGLDLRFTDLLGKWRHLTISGDAVRHQGAGLERMVMIDGSSLPGWLDASQSELMLWPDVEASWPDPFTPQPTALCIANAVDPATTNGYERCPRSALARTLEHLQGRGICDEIKVGIDLSFYLFDGLEVGSAPTASGFRIEQRKHVALAEQAYLNCPPEDAFADLRAEMMSVLERMGLEGLSHLQLRHSGHCEIKFGPASALAVADQVQLARYAIANVAQSYGKVASFMPYPVIGQPGNWMHLHINMWRDGKPLFAGQSYADLSDMCLYAVGGVLSHAPALNAFTNPTTNSYRRLRLTDREPVLLTYGAHNRSTAIRIPAAARREDKRFELRFPDPQANPYLAFASLFLAMEDGINRKTDPGEPMDRNLYDLKSSASTEIGRCSATLSDALDALEEHFELFVGDALPEGVLKAYVACKREEVELIESHPHPMEFQLYG